MKPLYKQEIHHFDDLYPISKAHESQVKRTVHSETKSQVLSLQLRGRPRCFQQCHKGSQILNPNKAQGHDKGSIQMLKICGNLLYRPLELIFSNYLANGIFPSD